MRRAPSRSHCPADIQSWRNRLRLEYKLSYAFPFANVTASSRRRKNAPHDKGAAVSRAHDAILAEISWLGGGFRFFSGSARCNWLQIKAGLSQIRQVETYPLHKAL